MSSDWAKMPKGWIADGELGSHRMHARSNQAANSQALKAYICIALKANFRANDEFDRAGSAKISYTQFEDMTGASRSLVGKGIGRLEELGLVEIERSANNKSVYVLNRYEEKSWVKLPKRHLLHGNSTLLEKMPLRQRLTLHSLKLYLALIGFQGREGGSTLLSYDKIYDYAGINKRFVRSAISNLIAYQLINVRNAEIDSSAPKNPPNEYIIRGFR